jgi:adenine phosphoribosyltransferase
LLIDPKATKNAWKSWFHLKEKIDKVIGVESRGFFFGMMIAQELNVGFVPVRKPNKLPYDTISASYELEYGTDTPEIHTDAIHPQGDRVLIHDDVPLVARQSGL